MLSEPQRAKPLDGIHVAVTRAEGRGGPLADALRGVGATVTELPLTRIETLDGAPLREALVNLGRYRWILLTSVNAVEHVAAMLAELQRRLIGPHLAVVGSGTAAAAEQHGWVPAVVPEKFVAESLLDALASRTDVEGARILYPSAAGARDVLPSGLRALGATVDVIPVYRSAPDPDGQKSLRRLVESGALSLVTVAAPSAVDALLDALPAERARRLPVACIGPVTARAARTAGFPVKVEAEYATIPGFVKAIVAAFGRSG